MVPFLGAGANLRAAGGGSWEDGYLPSGVELAAYLAEPYGYPEDLDLLRVSQWVELVSGERALVDELHGVFSRDYQPNELHRSSPSCRTLREQEHASAGS